ncbi:MAG TPA: precorrin-3B C(17)-methyltransferase [Acidimicrobiales bacterium]|nr:precorrin-3B C(17)-methyltransferase [Acidimicrobiales bacterium]
MRVVSISLTQAGATLARRLPYEHRHGGVAETLRQEWTAADGFVVIAATGIAVRAVGPLLRDKATDPAVVCIDDAGRFAVALTGGHAGGANQLAAEVAALLSAVPVVSTATDLAGLPALDRLPGFSVEGDVASVTRRWLDGQPPRVAWEPGLEGWRPPFEPGTEGGAVTVTDAGRAPGEHEVLLRPPSLVIGVGTSRGADPAGLARTVDAVLASAGRAPASVAAVATVDLKADEPAVVELARSRSVPLLTFPAPVLAGQPVPHPSPVVAAAVGTPSVAEAAALVAAGPGAVLVTGKEVGASGDCTVAVARRLGPAGHLAVVGLGPGRADRRTPEAAAAVRHADVVIGYGPYVDQASDLLRPAQTVIRSPIGAEVARVRDALARAAGGARVALVCSGDPGVYALASLACELAPDAGHPALTVVPGVTAALAGAAVLGAPLGHDHAAVSLSDLLTPWEVITRRVRAVAEADFVVSFYNPRSERRSFHLSEALAILAAHRPPATPAAVLTDIGRPGQAVLRTTLGELDPGTVGMLSLVIVGSTRTVWLGARMVTPRGYPL